MKTCTKCGKHKKSSEFFKRNDTKSWQTLRSHCKDCTSKKTSTYYSENSEKYKSLSKEWYIKNRSRLVEYNKNHKEETRQYNLMKKYGIGLDDFDALLKIQGGLCAICKKSSGTKPLFVDHCHKTGKVRGLLCGSCNSAIGLLKESTTSMTRAIKYLKK